MSSCCSSEREGERNVVVLLIRERERERERVRERQREREREREKPHTVPISKGLDPLTNNILLRTLRFPVQKSWTGLPIHPVLYPNKRGNNRGSTPLLKLNCDSRYLPPLLPPLSPSCRRLAQRNISAKGTNVSFARSQYKGFTGTEPQRLLISS
jgi:hypothetical protein